jgi:hypothetical protein
MILNVILTNSLWLYELDLCGPEFFPMANSWVHGNESSASINVEELNDQLSSYQLLNKDCDPVIQL